MSGEESEIIDKTFLKKIISIEKDKNIFSPSSKNEEIILDEKDENEINTKYITSSESPYTSNSDISNDFNHQFFNEPNNTFSNENNIIEKEQCQKNIFPEIDYFIFNEKYLKEKIPEGNNYKKKSKNYILKSKFRNDQNKKDIPCNNKISIGDLDLSKVNDILKDIEFVQDNMDNNIDTINNKFNNIDFPMNNHINLDELSNIPIEAFKTVDNSLTSEVNECKFDCKLKYFFIFL